MRTLCFYCCDDDGNGAGEALLRTGTPLAEKLVSHFQETPYGRLAPPLGSARMSAVALAAVLLRTGAPLAEELAVRVRLLPACLQLFLRFPFNSILHHQARPPTL